MNGINLPSVQWYLGGSGGNKPTNAYSGSLGTLPETGCFNVSTFHYSARAKQEDNEEKTLLLAVDCYIRQSRKEGGEILRPQASTFPLTEEGIAQAESWLLAQSAGLQS